MNEPESQAADCGQAAGRQAEDCKDDVTLSEHERARPACPICDDTGVYRIVGGIGLLPERVTCQCARNAPDDLLSEDERAAMRQAAIDRCTHPGQWVSVVHEGYTANACWDCLLDAYFELDD